ncbi:MAG: molybdopterin converting factor subunit 1 [Candidatus Tectimicrobiota bacterium]
MQITVKLFALMREKAGTDTVRLDVPEGSTVMQAVRSLVERYPSLETYVDKARYALQMDFVEPTAPVAEGDELALIPPVSGGIS